MNRVFGFVILFAAAWLMYRLQAGSGSCCGSGYSAPDSETRQDRHGCKEKEHAGPSQQRARAAPGKTGTVN